MNNLNQVSIIPGVVNLRLLGGGGYGDVYMGTRSGTNDPVVVKFLRDGHIPENRRAFEREVRILSMKVANVVPILWSDVKATRPYYVMPLLPHGSLTQFAGRLATQQVEGVGAIVADALSQLHSKWVYHGDIKPDNLLVDRNGQTLVADPLGNGCGCTMLFAAHRGGTPGYCAPEVVKGAEISAAGDVFSLGVTLHHLVTGQRPTAGSSFELSPSLQISRHLREAISLATRKEPAQRPSAKELARVLRGVAWANICAERDKAAAWGVGLGVAALALIAVFGSE